MLNRVVLIGRLTKDVELRYTTNGNATCSFTLACDRPMKDAEGNKQTDFLSVTVPPYRGKLAELVANALEKGKLAAVDGSVQVRNYTDNEGKKHYITEICAEQVRFLSPKGEQPRDTGTPAFGHEVNLDDDIQF
jgi:single-strand DNA-binding protein